MCYLPLARAQPHTVFTQQANIMNKVLQLIEYLMN